MESIKHFFVYQWQRKLVALLIALIVWTLVNHTITSTKTIVSVPIRIINLPVDKTVQGLLPNGFLSKRATLTLTGTKDVIDQLEPGDIEVILDVSNQPNEGPAQITKKNLVSLNPNVNLLHHITSISHSEILLKMHLLLTEKIPISIHTPTGSPPDGYDYLDIWPTKLYQTVTGPQDLVLNLKNKGLELTFNLNEISKEELDALQAQQPGPYDDEVSFPIPEQWKKISIPLNVVLTEPLNSPSAKELQVTFLKKESLPLKNDVPLNVFYPLKSIAEVSPETYQLKEGPFLFLNHKVPVLKLPLTVRNVAKLFLDIVKDDLQITIVAAPKSEGDALQWSLDIVNAPHLEDTYVAYLLSSLSSQGNPKSSQEKEPYFRQRFRTYVQNFKLYLPNGLPLTIDSYLDHGQIVFQVLNVSPSIFKNSDS